MDNAMIGFMTIALMVLVQIGMFAYGYGKLSQKVNNLCERTASLEKKVNNTDEHLDKLTERLAKIEGR